MLGFLEFDKGSCKQQSRFSIRIAKRSTIVVCNLFVLLYMYLVFLGAAPIRYVQVAILNLRHP